MRAVVSILKIVAACLGGLLWFLLVLPLYLSGLVLVSVSLSGDPKKADERLAVEREQLLTVLGENRCPACGVAYGRELALKSRDDWWAYCAEARRGYAHVSFVRSWPIECPYCGKVAYFFYEKKCLSENQYEV